MTRPDRRATALLAGGIALAAALVLGSVFTPAPHTGGDNATYLSLGHSLAAGTGYVEHWDPGAAPHTKYPPLFPALLAGLVLAGASTWTTFKLLSALAVGSAVLFAFGWAAQRRGPLAGAAVALLTLLAGGWIDAGRWILSEPPFLLLTFLGLWGAEVGMTRIRPIGAAARAAPVPDPERVPGHWGWTALAAAAALLAFFTRSAGLPLVLALGGVLLATRRWRTGAIFGAAFALPAAWWVLRAQGGGEGAYQSEFWMVNPYEPGLGTIGILDLPVRAWENLKLYAGEILGAQWWGSGSIPTVAIAGLVIAALALWGWTLRVRLGAGVAELFVPLYFGLILFWPEVWSGDRFLLPLIPILLLYAGEAVRYAALPLGKTLGTAVLAAGILLLALPAVPGWLRIADAAGDCRRMASLGDVFECHAPSFREFRSAAAWSGANLPGFAVVLNRKPSMFHLLGGKPGRIFPFTGEPGPFLDEADRLGAAYVLFDHLDGISALYLSAVIRARPGAFCHLIGWGGGESVPGTELFGILAPSERIPGRDIPEIYPCPASYRRAQGREPVIEGVRIPLLVGAESPGQASPVSP
ncbi:MAG: hypothetical protein WD804_03135 [Gemmatimonadota bacterium]